MTSREIVHRLLFEALLEMRSVGHASGNKVVFHLADLFHNAVLRMASVESEAPGSYDDVLAYLQEKAKEKGCERWLEERMQAVRARSPQAASALPVEPGREFPIQDQPKAAL